MTADSVSAANASPCSSPDTGRCGASAPISLVLKPCLPGRMHDQQLPAAAVHAGTVRMGTCMLAGNICCLPLFALGKHSP